MAQVTRTAPTFLPPNAAEWIDDFLDYLTAAWQGLPETAAEWPGWDEHSKFMFAIDWDVPNDRLSTLRQWADHGLLSPGQRARYDALMALVAEYQATLDWLLGDDS